MFTGVESFENDKMKAIDKVNLMEVDKGRTKEHGTVDLRMAVSDKNVPMSQVNDLRL